MKYHSAIDFGIIGLGRFGTALALSLAQEGREVLAMDRDEHRVKNVQEAIAQALVVETLDKASLSEAGIQNCDTVIVCVGEEIQASIIATLNVIELGVKRVISKAVSGEHGRVLAKIGADVIYPEKEQALRLAQILTNSRAIDRIELSDEFMISEFVLSDACIGKRVIDSDIRGRYGLNIIAIVNASETIVEIDPAYTFAKEDHIVVVGKKENINQLEREWQL